MKLPRASAQPSTPSTDLPVHFFRNYTRLMALVYGLILLGLMLYFVVQLRERFASQIELIESNVKRHSLFVEHVIGKSRDQLDNLHMLVDDEVDIAARAAKNGRPPLHWPAFAVRVQGGESSFSIERPIDFDRTGNLSGVGSLVGRSPEFYGDMEQALLINAGLRSLIFTLPNAARARFLATEQFLLVSPWRPLGEAAFSSDNYLDPIWRLGSTEVNPDREKQWAPVYFGGGDKGLLVPVLVPVYREQRLVGVLAIDTSLDYLNRLYSDFVYPKGTLMLVDAYRQVLAHPWSYADPPSMEKPPAFADVLPAGLQPKDLTLLPQDTHRILNGHVVIAHHFVGAPWTQYFLVNESEIWWQVLAEQSVAMLAALIGLVVVMAVTYLVTSMQFVTPVAKLLRRLAAASNFKPSAIPWRPTAWRPWFESLTEAFKDSMHRMGLQQDQDDAARLQQSILPVVGWPSHPDYDLWGTLRGGAEVGGNFYDQFEAGDGLRGLVVADVTGDDLGPGLFGMRAQILLHVTATQVTQQVAKVMESVNDGLCQGGHAYGFVTAVCLMFRPDTGALWYCNAGHPPPMRIGANGRVTLLPVVGGLALGIKPGTAYQAGELALHAGDTVLLCSEGVFGARNLSGDAFGQDRVADLFREQRCHSAREAVERVVSAVHDFSQGVDPVGDITCLALVYQPRVLAA